MSKHKKIWESIYQDKEYVIDFTNQIILKDEFKTNKPYSWDYDYFDYDDEEKFIANQDVVIKRNKQSIFDYKNEKYISVRNEDYSYSILSPSKLIDLENPINYDLLLAHKLNNYQSSNYAVFSLSYKKMVPFINDIFISYICECLKANLDFTYMRLDHNNFYKNKLYFLVDKNKFNVKEILNISLKIKSLIQLFILRSIEKFNVVWNNENDIDDGLYFNLFLFTYDNKENENIFIANEKLFLSYVEAFDNRILINPAFKKELEHHGILSSDFVKLYQYDQDNIVYSYDYLNSKFNAFYLNIKNRRK